MSRCPKRICKRFVIASGIAFLIAHGLMTFYERCQEPEEITSTQMEELSRHVINLDQIEVLAEEKPTDTTSV